MVEKERGPFYVIGYAGATAAVFTAAIMALYAVTNPIAERNQRLLRQKALVQLFQLGDVERMSDQQIVQTVENQIQQGPTINDPETQQNFELLRAKDKNGELIGYGVPISGVGYWALIRGMLAVTPDLDHTIGVVFFSHSETPGLGGRITTIEFRKQFTGGQQGGFRVTPPQDEEKFLYLGGEKTDSPSNPRYRRVVDSLSGATQTSQAVVDFMNEDLRRFRRAAKASELLEGSAREVSE